MLRTFNIIFQIKIINKNFKIYNNFNNQAFNFANFLSLKLKKNWRNLISSPNVNEEIKLYE